MDRYNCFPDALYKKYKNISKYYNTIKSLLQHHYYTRLSGSQVILGNPIPRQAQLGHPVSPSHPPTSSPWWNRLPAWAKMPTCFPCLKSPRWCTYFFNGAISIHHAEIIKSPPIPMLCRQGLSELLATKTPNEAPHQYQNAIEKIFW